MSFSLRRTRDGAGETGACSQAIKFDGSGFGSVVSHQPTVGCSMLVGSIIARTYSRDLWLTTTITEILEEVHNDDVHYIKFRTTNSDYEWWNGIYPFKQ